MHKGLFSEEDNKSLAETIQELQRSHSEPPVEIVDLPQESELEKKAKQARLDELNKITHISQLKNVQGEAPHRKVYFTTGKGKYKLDLDNSPLKPSPSVMLSYKSFETNYSKQLDAMIYNDQDELDVGKLIGLIQMVSLVKNNKDLIQVKSSKLSRTLPVIVKCINAFFVKNRSVIFGMEQMFNGMGHENPTAQEQPTG